jgi:hypothetical protein
MSAEPLDAPLLTTLSAEPAARADAFAAAEPQDLLHAMTWERRPIGGLPPLDVEDEHE